MIVTYPDDRQGINAHVIQLLEVDHQYNSIFHHLQVVDLIIITVHPIDTIALHPHWGQAPIPPSLSPTIRETAGTSRRRAPWPLKAVRTRAGECLVSVLAVVVRKNNGWFRNGTRKGVGGYRCAPLKLGFGLHRHLPAATPLFASPGTQSGAPPLTGPRRKVEGGVGLW